MENLITVKYFKDCVPQKGVWYCLHGDIFISVMLSSKPHVRRKAIPPDNKQDNNLSDWHREWQYDKIENQYGEVGVKTYEININVDNEVHRIDSLVKNTAIEFQHTLSVSLEEMNSRFIAHKIYGCIPYLVLNLTNFTFLEFITAISNNGRTPLTTKLNKWTNSEYCRANNLFIDLQDCMVRVVSNIEMGYIKLQVTEFISELCYLENILNQKLKEDKERISKREEQLKIEKEKAAQRSLERERERFYHEKFENPDYKHFRFCFGNPAIKPYVLPYNREVFNYMSYSETEYGYLEKNHKYYSKESDFEIIYKTISKIIETEIQTYRRIQTKKDYKFEHAEIQLIKQNKILAKFKIIGNNVQQFK